MRARAREGQSQTREERERESACEGCHENELFLFGIATRVFFLSFIFSFFFFFFLFGKITTEEEREREKAGYWRADGVKGAFDWDRKMCLTLGVCLTTGINLKPKMDLSVLSSLLLSDKFFRYKESEYGKIFKKVGNKVLFT